MAAKCPCKNLVARWQHLVSLYPQYSKPTAEVQGPSVVRGRDDELFVWACLCACAINLVMSNLGCENQYKNYYL